MVKFLQCPKLLAVTNEHLTNRDLGDRVICGRMEAYSCKKTGSDKKLQKQLEKNMQQELSSTPPAKLETSPIGSLNEATTRKLLIDLACTLTAAYPDYDFSSIRPEEFQSLDPQAAITAINSLLLDPLEQADSGIKKVVWDAVNEVIQPLECDAFAFSFPEEDAASASQSTLVPAYSFTYFFYHKKMKKILFFACEARSKLRTKKKLLPDDDDDMDLFLSTQPASIFEKSPPFPPSAAPTSPSSSSSSDTPRTEVTPAPPSLSISQAAASSSAFTELPRYQLLQRVVSPAINFAPQSASLHPLSSDLIPPPSATSSQPTSTSLVVMAPQPAAARWAGPHRMDIDAEEEEDEEDEDFEDRREKGRRKGAARFVVPSPSNSQTLPSAPPVLPPRKQSRSQVSQGPSSLKF